MYLVSLMLEDEIFVIGDSDLEPKFFKNEDQFFSFLNTVTSSGADPDDGDIPVDNLQIAAIVFSGGPRIHRIQNDDEIVDIMEEETEVISISGKDFSTPLITLINCKGPTARSWRERGVGMSPRGGMGSETDVELALLDELIKMADYGKDKLSDPAGVTAPIETAPITTPSITTPSITTPSITTPSIATPSIATPSSSLKNYEKEGFDIKDYIGLRPLNLSGSIH